jgi:hypothetical protein
MFAPIPAQVYRTVMIAREIPGDREAQIAFIAATLEGTMAGAGQILGAEAAFNAVQPLVDRMLAPALGRA